MSRHRCWETAVLMAVAITMTTALAAGNGDHENQSIAGSDANWVVPDTPAFTALGVTPSQVTIPSSPRELALAVASGLGDSNTAQQAVAIDATPYLLWAGSGLTIKDYRNSHFARLLARSDVSFATAKGQDSSDPAFRAAAGLRMTLLDYGDPRLDRKTDECFSEATKFTDWPSPADIPDEATKLLLLEKRDELVSKKVAGCHRESLKRNWNGSAWDVAVVPTWIDTSGGSDSLKQGGVSVWSSIAYGFEHVPALERRAQVIFLVRRDSDRFVPDPGIAGQYRREDSWNGGLRLRYGGDDATLNLEYLQMRIEPHDASTLDSEQYSIGADIRVGEELWLNLSTGHVSRSDSTDDQNFVNTGLRWGFSSKPTQTVP